MKKLNENLVTFSGLILLVLWLIVNQFIKIPNGVFATGVGICFGLEFSVIYITIKRKNANYSKPTNKDSKQKSKKSKKK